MKSTRTLTTFIILILIIISLLGFFEERAFKFISKVMEKNVSFLSLVSEIKLILTGLSTINIPFLSGHSVAINDSLSKIQNYLIITNAITYIQILLIAISKSLIFKLFMVTVFILTFFHKSKQHAIKLLIILLAFSPGLSFYTVVIQKVSQEVSIDFGEAYILKLNNTVDAVKSENAKLMIEHSKAITKINNGQKGIVPLKKFAEDISYDFKKVENKISGDYKEMRILIHTAAKEMTAKLYNFGSMLLFCFLIMPIGYAFLIYILFNSLFKDVRLEAALNNLASDTKIPSIAKMESEPKVKAFFIKIRNIGKAIKYEFSKAKHNIEQSGELGHAKEKIQNMEDNISNSIKNKLHQEEDTIKKDLQQSVSDLHKTAEQKMEDEKSKISNDMHNVEKEGNIKDQLEKHGSEKEIEESQKTNESDQDSKITI